MYTVHTLQTVEELDLLEIVPSRIYPPEILPIIKMSDKINEDFFLTAHVVEKNDKVLGRLVLYGETGISVDGKKTLIIGNYECEDDPGAAAELFDVVTQTAKLQGYEMLLGPMNGTTWDTYRFRKSGNSDIFFSEMFHRAYYNRQWETAGFTEAAHYVSCIDRKLEHDSPAVLQKEKELLEAGVNFRNMRLADFEHELEKLFSFCEKTFSSNAFYTAIPRELFIEKYLSVKDYLVQEGIVVAENSAGAIVGFIFGFPDHLYKMEKRFVVKTLARDPAPVYKGIAHVLGNKITRYVKQKGYDAAIHAFMHIDNRSVNVSSHFSGEPLREYALYKKEL